MILRGTQISERRLTLPTTIAPASERSTIAEPVAPNKIEATAPTTVAKSAFAGLGNSSAPPERIERPLTFETVVAWLAVQDEETRNGCAAILATEVTKTYETAKRDGFAAGRSAGELAAKKDAEHLIKLLQQIAVNAQAAFDQEQEQLQNVCVDVVGEAIAKIAGPLLNTKQAALGAIKEILSRVKEARELLIRVAHADYELVSKLDVELSAALGTRKYEVVADGRVELGGCIVETKLGNLDGRFEVQLRELYETLRLAKLAAPELT